jgi:transcriptional enhancer factor
MEPRHILPSTYPSPHLPPDDPSGQSRFRQPLSDAAGNSQLQTLAPAGIYNDNKYFQPRPGHTVPLQPARQTLGSTLELRRQGNRRRRHQRIVRNPIVDSPQYQAYRTRQDRDGNSEDAKWPLVLEDAFLDGNALTHLSLLC